MRASHPTPDAWRLFEDLLSQQRQALMAGDLSALERTSSALRAWLTDPIGRSALAQATPLQRKLAQAQIAMNAQCSARAQASTDRALSCMARAPAVYTMSGGIQTANRSQRRTAA